MTHLRAKGTPHGHLKQIKVCLDEDTFARVSRMAYAHNVPVSSLLRGMIKQQVKAVEV